MTTMEYTETRRERHRRELAEVLERDVTALADSAHLRDDLGLDSMALMSVLAWLEARGVVATAQRGQPTTVGDILALVGTADHPGLSVRITDAEFGAARATDVPVAPPVRSPLAPALSNHDLRLTPVEPDDVRFLYSLATHPETCYRWRYRGVPPSTDRFLADLWAQVLVQFVARRTDDGEPVGHVVAYGADLGQGYAYMGAVFRPPYSGSGLAAQGSAMFIRYLFHSFALRKLYIEVPGFNWPQMRSGEGRLFQVEGIMRDHEHYAGRYWDRYLCAVYPAAVSSA